MTDRVKRFVLAMLVWLRLRKPAPIEKEEEVDEGPDFWSAMHIVERWYVEHVHDLADEYDALLFTRMEEAEDRELAEWIEAGEMEEDFAFDSAEAAEELDEEMRQWLHESIDGHEIIIYTMKAKAVLLISNNEGAYEDEIGEGGSVEARAYMAFETDVMQSIGRG